MLKVTEKEIINIHTNQMCASHYQITVNDGGCAYAIAIIFECNYPHTCLATGLVAYRSKPLHVLHGI